MARHADQSASKPSFVAPDSARAGTPVRAVFLYWGRRGISSWVLEIARAAAASAELQASFCISRQNERFEDFAELGDALIPVDTFSSAVGALLSPWRIGALRQQMRRQLRSLRPAAVIELMPHIWSPFVSPVIKASGARHAVLVHDAAIHPGDYRSAAAAWMLRRTARNADVLLTLSRYVADQLRAQGLAPQRRVCPLFLPDLSSPHPPRPADAKPHAPWRLLFLGRILPYKGLPLFLDAVEELARRGIRVQVGVYGEGHLGANAKRLATLGADVANRWLSDAEIGALVPRYDAVVLSHLEASQSGVASVAFSAGVPVVATPVGALPEQVVDGVTGIVAERVDAKALADALVRLLSDPVVYHKTCRNLAASGERRSVHNFVRRCLACVLGIGAEEVD